MKGRRRGELVERRKGTIQKKRCGKIDSSKQERGGRKVERKCEKEMDELDYLEERERY